MHCRYGNYESFGEGDLKAEGVKKFFQTHSCNGICKKLNLRQLCEYNEVPPRAVVTFPGLSTDFLRELTKGTLQRVRKQFGLTEAWQDQEVFDFLSVFMFLMACAIFARLPSTTRALVHQFQERIYSSTDSTLAKIFLVGAQCNLRRSSRGSGVSERSYWPTA